jgi:DNA-binding transcriptional regulator GbsR (MarR family)
MSGRLLNEEKKRLVEDVGIFFKQAGMPRMAGRVLGWLLICDPPYQSLDELVEALIASKGSISTMTRLLIQVGLVERFSLPGVRHDHFRIKPGGWHQVLMQSINDIKTGRELAERGLELTKKRTSPNRRELEEFRDMYAFFERELPALLKRWEQERNRRQLQTHKIP